MCEGLKTRDSTECFCAKRRGGMAIDDDDDDSAADTTEKIEPISLRAKWAIILTSGKSCLRHVCFVLLDFANNNKDNDYSRYRR